MKKSSIYLISALVASVSTVTLAMGYPENTDLGSEGDFLWKRGTEYGRTAILAPIGPYLANIPEGPGSSGIALPNNEVTFASSIWDLSDLTNPLLLHQYENSGQPLHSHATVTLFTTQGPRLLKANNSTMGYDPSGVTALDQLIVEDTHHWGNDIFAYPQMTSPFVTRAYWDYGLNTEGVFAIHDPSQQMQLPGPSEYVYSSGPIRDLFNGPEGDFGVWSGEPYVYWNHRDYADTTGFVSFFGHYMIMASDQLSTGMAIYDVSGVRDGRIPRLISVYNPRVTQPDGVEIGIGGYWMEPYGTTKMVYAARRHNNIGRTYPALYVVDFTDVTDPKLSCEIYFDRDDNDSSDGDSSSDPMYVNFQDNYIYVDHFKVDLTACETAYENGLEISGDTFSDVVYRFQDIPNQCDGSQYFRPLGQLGVFGGYDWWETFNVNEQGMCGFLTSDEPDTRPPYISGHRPFENQTDYPIDGFIQFHIPETLRSETVENAISVTNLDAGETVSFRQLLSHTGTLSIFPDQYLAPNSQYRVDIVGIQDYMGNTMIPYTFTFTTGNGDLLKGETPFPPLNYADPHPGATIPDLTGREPEVPVAPTYSGPSYAPRQSSPISCQLDTESGDVWVVNPDNDSVSIVSSSVDDITMDKSHQLENEIYLLYEAPTSVTRYGDEYAVTYRDDDKVVFFSATGIPIFSIDTGHGTQPIASVTDDQYLYVALYGSGEVIKIDPVGRTIEQRLSVGPTPKAMALFNDRLLVSRFISPVDRGEVYDIRLSEPMQNIGVIAINKIVVGDDINHGDGVPNYLSSIVINADGTSAYVSATKANIDRGLRMGSTNQQALDSDNTVRPMVAVLDLVNNRDANTDPNTRENTIDLDNGADPSAVGYLANPDVRVTALSGNNILIFNNTTENSVAQFDTRGAPQGLCATRRTLYVKNFTDRSLSAIDVSWYLYNGSVRQNIETTVTVQDEVLNPEEKRGLELFYSASMPEMGPEGYMTCASCHFGGGHDGRTWDLTQMGEGVRNTLSLNGASGTRFGNLHWSGNFDEVQDFELQMEFLNQGEGLVPGATFTDESPLEMTTTGLSEDLDALAAYISGLGKDTVKRSPYKTYQGELTEAAARGKALFMGEGLEGNACSSCHSSEAFRDGQMHDVGTISLASGNRLGEPIMAIRTPTLIELWNSAPYFHDGSAGTLTDVLQREAHFIPLYDSERADLIEYLLSIDREEYIDDVN